MRTDSAVAARPSARAQVLEAEGSYGCGGGVVVVGGGGRRMWQGAKRTGWASGGEGGGSVGGRLYVAVGRWCQSHSLPLTADARRVYAQAAWSIRELEWWA